MTFLGKQCENDFLNTRDGVVSCWIVRDISKRPAVNVNDIYVITTPTGAVVMMEGNVHRGTCTETAGVVGLEYLNFPKSFAVSGTK